MTTGPQGHDHELQLQPGQDQQNDDTTQIGGNRTAVVTNNSPSPSAWRTQTIGMTDTVSVGAARIETVGAAETITVGAARSITIGGAQTVQIGDSQSINAVRSDNIGRIE